MDLDIRLSALEHPAIDAADLHVRGKIVSETKGEHLKIEGEMTFDFGSFVTAKILAGTGQIKWNGIAERDASKMPALSLSGKWSSRAENIALPDPARRKSLAQTLSLSETLLKAPIAQNFSSELTRKIISLLERSDIEAEGQLDLNEQGLAVSLSGPAFMRGLETRLRMEQTDWAPLYNFSHKDEKLRLAFHAQLSEPAGLTFREADLVASSKNGWQLGGVERFSADISTTQPWRSKGIDGRGARLAPFKTETVYKGAPKGSQRPRNMLINGGVDYDGTVPGGYVTGLKTAGRMTMDLSGGAMSVRFKPESQVPIKIEKLETDTQWRGEGVSAILLSDTPIFTRNGTSSAMIAELAQVSLMAIDDTNTKNLAMTFEAMNVSGELKGESQSWDILGRNAKIQSEDMPGAQL